MTPPAAPAAPILEVSGLGKRFPGVTALEDVTLSLRPGEVHGLVGQNGAGKSTLISILAGLERPDVGVIRLDGREVRFENPRQAQALGIATVYQELSLLPNLSVAENLSLGREPRRWGLLDRRGLRASARAALDRLGLAIDPDAPVGRLPLAEKQLVEIAKALSNAPRVLVLDEPTAPLGPRECGILFEAVRRLKAQGVTVLYVSHRFAEILALCDRATVLRNGQVVLTTGLAGWTEGRLTDAMIGVRSEAFERQGRPRGAPFVELAGVGLQGRLAGIDLAVHRGEILGVTGLLGAGQNLLARVLGGDLAPDAGEIRVDGAVRRLAGPHDAVAAGICLLTEERKQDGILPNLSLRENIAIGSLRARRRWLGAVDAAAERQATERAGQEFSVVAASPETPARSLSGGNQQKALLARWHLADMEAFILVEPTRGVDVGARAEIYRRLDALARAGKAVVVVSSDLPEVLALSDRIAVVRGGRIVAEVAPESVTEERLNLLVQRAEAA